jgi:GSH-dependent disulfide-bond oxidoreductase
VIDVYFWPTGNGKKITIMLEEVGVLYRIVPVNIGRGDQYVPDFEAINPNRKMPAIVDHVAGNAPLIVFESGAILQYLAEKTGKLLPMDMPGKYRVLQWVYWQAGGLGPMAGQAHHFLKFASQRVEYAIDRYRSEVTRLYRVLDKQLAAQDFIAGSYSIADIAAWPWVARYDWQGQKIEDFPNLNRWFSLVGARPAVQRAVQAGADLLAANTTMPEEEKHKLREYR